MNKGKIIRGEICLKGSGSVEIPLYQVSRLERNDDIRDRWMPMGLTCMMLYYMGFIFLLSGETCQGMSEDRKVDRRFIVFISTMFVYNPGYIYFVRTMIKQQGGSERLQRCKATWLIYVLLVFNDLYLYLILSCW